jgi:putative ABC transport system permease protein
MNRFNQFSLGWRNLWRNRRRSLVTILSLAFGFAAVALFAGYTSSVYLALSNAAIHGELIGHLTVNREGWQTEGKLRPDKFLLSAQEIASVREIVARRLPGARVVPKLSASGLLSNGKSSTIFIANGIAPDDLNILRGPFRNAPGALSDDKPSGVTLAQGLADVLGFKIGDSASVLSSTIHGQANAADVDVTDAVNTGNVATNDKLMLMPLALTQSLMDAPGRAESLTVLLASGPVTAGNTQDERMRSIYTTQAPGEQASVAIRDLLDADFRAAGLKLEVRTWQQMSAFFRQVKGMYDMIFALMLTVVLAIVVLSIANAMSMAVVERTREIGTLRAIGMRRSGITMLFVSEALMLVLVGIAAGLLLTALTRFGVNAADIRYVPPGNTSSVPIYIGFDVPRTVTAALVLSVLAVLAAFLPARRAARHPITESLGHV